MKNVDVKSLVIGVLSTLLVLSLLSSRLPEPDSALDVGYTGAGFGIFNRRTNTIYLYKGGTYSPMEIKPKPYAVYQISENGSGLAEVTPK
jgi:hypothetical protein